MKGKLPPEQSGKIESTLPKKAALPFTKKTPTKTPLKSSAATTYNLPSFENIMGLESGGSIADDFIGVFVGVFLVKGKAAFLGRVDSIFPDCSGGSLPFTYRKMH